MLESAAVILALLLSTSDNRYSRVITIPPGVYQHDSVITLRHLHDLTIKAYGVTFLIPAGPLVGCVPAWIRIHDSDRITIEGLAIIDLGSDSFGCREQTHGITVSRSSDITLTNLTITGVGDECIQTGTQGARISITHNRFNNCVRESPQAAGAVTVHGSTQVDVSHNTFTNQDRPQASAIRIEASARHGTTVKGVTIIGNLIDNVAGGALRIAVTNDVDGVIFKHNSMFNAGLRPIYIRGFRGAQITNLIVGDNLDLRD